MLDLIRRVAGLAPGRPLLKTAFPGGLLQLRRDALIYGEGLLGARNVSHYPLGELGLVAVEPRPRGAPGVRLRIELPGGEELLIDGVSPLAARRFMALIERLRPRG